MSSDSREQLRATFGEVPELYDRVRPGYPAALFDDLTELARLPKAARILEIGCGTGQATIALANRGYHITCVELGERLAGLARRRLSGFPAVEIFNADFESWEPREAEFDAIVAFTAFHWIDPDLSYAKTATLLRNGGALAIAGNETVMPPGGDQFFVDVQEDYRAVVPGAREIKAGAPVPPEEVGDMRDEIAGSGFFQNVTVRRYLWEATYTADEYIALLNTYSGQRALEHAARERLHHRIRRRIESRPEGTVRTTYLSMLNVARLRRAAAG